MKERIVIGLLIVAGIGVAAYVLSLPEEGTLEWNKREYLRARKELEGRTLCKQIQRFWVRVGFAPRPTSFSIANARQRELRKYEEVLIRLGFLEAKKVQVSRPFAAQFPGILDEGRAAIPEKRWQFAQLSTPGPVTIPSFVNLVAPREDIAVWERLIRRADAAAPPIHLFEERDMTNDSLLLRAPERLPPLEKMLRKTE